MLCTLAGCWYGCRYWMTMSARGRSTCCELRGGASGRCEIFELIRRLKRTWTTNPDVDNGKPTPLSFPTSYTTRPRASIIPPIRQWSHPWRQCRLQTAIDWRLEEDRRCFDPGCGRWQGPVAPNKLQTGGAKAQGQGNSTYRHLPTPIDGVFVQGMMRGCSCGSVTTRLSTQSAAAPHTKSQALTANSKSMCL